MNLFLASLLRIGLAAAFLVGLYTQVVVVPSYLPVQAVIQSRSGILNWVFAYFIAAVLGIAFMQVVLVAGWMLLSRARRGEFLGRSAFRWMDVIIAATGAATLLAIGVVIHLTILGAFPGRGYAPDEFGIAVLLAVAGIAFGTLMVGLRALMRRAAELKAEMAEVI